MPSLPKQALRASPMVGALALPDLASATQTDAADLDPMIVQAPKDPWEGFNRGAFGLNRGIDRFAIGPIGRGYLKITPRVVRARVTSAVANLGEPRTAINDLAQGRAKAAGVAASRFVLNSTVGGLGMFDVGGKLGLDPHVSDFGRPWAGTELLRAAMSSCRSWGRPPSGTA